MLRWIDLIDLFAADAHFDVTKLHHPRYQFIAFVFNISNQSTEILRKDRRILWQVAGIEVNPHYPCHRVWSGLHQHLLGLGWQALLLIYKSLQRRLDFLSDSSATLSSERRNIRTHARLRISN
ncbi:hypothetical protein TP48_15485 [Xanthomonas citri pv. citri]|nr:hypothetical protein AB890_16540 [Xanthomonas citri pv. citri]OOW50601.1 hypothetical protein BFQ41_17665 [Xanthomonas citri pv. citri]PIB19527.1 hypothetical protein AA099_18880 [Xanthomonas citri pv. citri]PWE97008.1 hypothetical protein TP48_15485 [Xanthomonas citri pv. citri]PWE97092.1 hypothetical protein TP44_16280 [Xanthomonas citri pv. citri]